VPYQTLDRVKNLSGVYQTSSLDALLVFGDGSLTITQRIRNPYDKTGESLTGTYPAWQTIASFRASRAGDYYVVGRIDGADAAAARALVDRTRQAESLAASGGLTGTVYVDGNRGLPHATSTTNAYDSAEWSLIGVENLFRGLGKPVVADYNSEEFGTAPAPLTAPDALYYAGWYSYFNYNDVFTWRPGAIGAHLDSASAQDFRGSRSWSAMALRRGVTATFGSVNEPYIDGIARYDEFFAYVTRGASIGEALYQSAPYGGWMIVLVGDPLYRPYAR
jgi:uncharacterized protein (TIGR03790 family)